MFSYIFICLFCVSKQKKTHIMETENYNCIFNEWILLTRRCDKLVMFKPEVMLVTEKIQVKEMDKWEAIQSTLCKSSTP